MNSFSCKAARKKYLAPRRSEVNDTYEKAYVNDPTKTKSYVYWMMREADEYYNAKLGLNEVFMGLQMLTQEILDVVRWFDVAKPSLSIDKRDIYKLRFHEAKHLMENHKTKNSIKKLSKYNAKNIVHKFEDDSILVKIDSYLSSLYWAHKYKNDIIPEGKWCIASYTTDKNYKSYSENNDILFYISNKKRFAILTQHKNPRAYYPWNYGLNNKFQIWNDENKHSLEWKEIKNDISFQNLDVLCGMIPGLNKLKILEQNTKLIVHRKFKSIQNKDEVKLEFKVLTELKHFLYYIYNINFFISGRLKPSNSYTYLKSKDTDIEYIVCNHENKHQMKGFINVYYIDSQKDPCEISNELLYEFIKKDLCLKRHYPELEKYEEEYEKYEIKDTYSLDTPGKIKIGDTTIRSFKDFMSASIFTKRTIEKNPYLPTHIKNIMDGAYVNFISYGYEHQSNVFLGYTPEYRNVASSGINNITIGNKTYRNHKNKTALYLHSFNIENLQAGQKRLIHHIEPLNGYMEFFSQGSEYKEKIYNEILFYVFKSLNANGIHVDSEPVQSTTNNFNTATSNNIHIADHRGNFDFEITEDMKENIDFWVIEKEDRENTVPYYTTPQLQGLYMNAPVLGSASCYTTLNMPMPMP